MLTLDDPLEHARRLHGSRIAVIDGERRVSYAELAQRALSLAAGLQRLGVQPGDRVALLSDRDPGVLGSCVERVVMIPDGH